MIQNAEKFWLDYQNENMQKFEKCQKDIKSYERAFWIALMTIQATLLGISMTFTQCFGTKIEIFMLVTWTLLILAMVFGIIVFKCTLDNESKYAISNFMFSMDIAEFNTKDTKKDFKSDEERAGMLIAAIIKSGPFKEAKCFTQYAKELAEKYKSTLPSEQYFTNPKYSKPIVLYKKLLQKLNDNINVLMTFFYLATFGAFLSLLINMFIRYCNNNRPVV